MKSLIIILLSLSIVSCEQKKSENTSITKIEYVNLSDGTLAVDSEQKGNFELTVLPSNLTGPLESNTKANMNSDIDLVIDSKLKIRVSTSKIIRIQGLRVGMHSIVELVDGVQTSSFKVDGSKEPRLVADYYEIYGNWIIRSPLK